MIMGLLAMAGQMLGPAYVTMWDKDETHGNVTLAAGVLVATLGNAGTGNAALGLSRFTGCKARR
jgi:hypothetical protein